MKTILKTLFQYKSPTILNIVGLSCAFATFIIISMQIRYDITYDKYNENYDSIYLLVYKDTLTGNMEGNSFNRPNATKIKMTIPEIEHISVLSSKYIDRITLLGENKQDIVQDITTCEEDITKIFTFEFIEGDESALKDPNNLIVSDRFAKKWYGDKSPIGESVLCDEKVYTIAAVYKSLPKNGTIHDDVYCNVGDDSIDDKTNWSFRVYVKLSDNHSKEYIDDKLSKSLGKAKRVPGTIELSKVRYMWGQYDNKTVYMMILIALSIITLASINFINFATSMVPLKIKGIKLRKVVGATQTELRANVIWESIILAVLSFFLAVGVVQIFKDSAYSYIIYDMSWETNKMVYLFALGVTLFTGIVSGLYPAFYSTSFQPALVLKSSYALSASGRKFRMGLIGFQFFVSLTFITITIFIQMQHNYLINRDGGYLKEGIIHVDHGWDFDKQDILKEELLKNKQIKEVAFSDIGFGIEEWGSTYSGDYSGGRYTLSIMAVSHNFLDFFEIKIDSGRNFQQSDYLSQHGYSIMSRMAMDKYQFLPAEKIYDVEVIGACEDVHIHNMKVAIEPYGFQIYGREAEDNLAHSYIKVSGGNSQEIFDHIQNSYKKINPDISIEANYMITELQNAYEDENTTKQIMQIFSFIAIIIALVGVFGLVSFDTKYRRKEIGLRKINGATISNILLMFSTTYIKIMLVSFVLSVPLVYYFIDSWLKEFPYKIEIYWWVFALALAMVFLLTIVISATQTISAARKNPIDALKTE